MSTIISNTGITFPSGNTQSSAGITSNNIPVLSVNYTSSTAIANSAYVKVPFNNVVKDTHSGWNSSNNSYTIQKSGYYQVNGSSTVYSAPGSYPALIIGVTRVNTSNAGSIQSGQFNSYSYGAVNTWGGTADAVMYFTAGNTVWVEAYGAVYAAPYSLYNENNWLNLYYIRS